VGGFTEMVSFEYGVQESSDA